MELIQAYLNRLPQPTSFKHPTVSEDWPRLYTAHLISPYGSMAVETHLHNIEMERKMVAGPLHITSEMELRFYSEKQAQRFFELAHGNKFSFHIGEYEMLGCYMISSQIIEQRPPLVHENPKDRPHVILKSEFYIKQLNQKSQCMQEGSVLYL